MPMDWKVRSFPVAMPAAFARKTLKELGSIHVLHVSYKAREFRVHMSNLSHASIGGLFIPGQGLLLLTILGALNY